MWQVWAARILLVAGGFLGGVLFSESEKEELREKIDQLDAASRKNAASHEEIVRKYGAAIAEHLKLTTEYLQQRINAILDGEQAASFGDQLRLELISSQLKIVYDTIAAGYDLSGDQKRFLRLAKDLFEVPEAVTPEELEWFLVWIQQDAIEVLRSISGTLLKLFKENQSHIDELRMRKIRAEVAHKTASFDLSAGQTDELGALDDKIEELSRELQQYKHNAMFLQAMIIICIRLGELAERKPDPRDTAMRKVIEDVAKGAYDAKNFRESDERYEPIDTYVRKYLPDVRALVHDRFDVDIFWAGT